ncbi:MULTISPECIES: 5-formyltetrahydrofolate cyclo-ligase [Campylobacter]|uniref:5-formyltetrahydrofolate cyclo-ligase n=1 Tax=Campylobacter TaxID=194 RepID=UPI00127B7CE1|nr:MULTISPECIES: 5-formyltetrahydrofolate cyclo-ligase [Campylobacter]MCR8708740.1 5-formyltetrahydrofolate cyclo-ligase [Campylobacter sp. RM5063]EAI8624078.1 5-formyltetrahydrofolate cyclo-ligase [Campylobacter lari]EAJ5677909.1 5-formyltetrahydrofolate cyclo-ligase [Campylobacter lari]EAK0441305.1 5-formyltetrahydrofolate cyclo-ligase [Campylobacter lari]EAK0444749.1 5-formyltetrahydrofolate cyclo-ligase [Campylobacter lari]
MIKNDFRIKQKFKMKLKLKFQYKRDFLVFQEVNKILKSCKNYKNILIYIPLKYEINLYKFRHFLTKKYRIFVPFMQDKSLKVVKLRLALDKKSFGVYEPKDSFLQTRIDVAIIPVIGVDAKLGRVGHGQGFYDRFFENISYKKPLVIFTQMMDAKSHQIFSQDHDIKGNFYINPYKKYFRKVKNNDRNISRINSRFHRRRDWIYSRQKD